MSKANEQITFVHEFNLRCSEIWFEWIVQPKQQCGGFVYASENIDADAQRTELYEAMQSLEEYMVVRARASLPTHLSFPIDQKLSEIPIEITESEVIDTSNKKDNLEKMILYAREKGEGDLINRLVRKLTESDWGQDGVGGFSYWSGDGEISAGAHLGMRIPKNKLQLLQNHILTVPQPTMNLRLLTQVTARYGDVHYQDGSDPFDYQIDREGNNVVWLAGLSLESAVIKSSKVMEDDNY